MQIINLYLPEFRPKRDLLSAVNCIACIALVVAAIVGTHIIYSLKIAEKEEVLVTLTNKNEELTKKSEILKNTPRGEDRKRIVRRISKIKLEIGNRGKILDVMTGKQLGNDKGFSRYMAALSNHAVDGVFLKRFMISKGGEYAQISGLSKKADLVPLYIYELQSETIFQDTKFGHLTISSAGNYAQFSSAGLTTNDE